MDDSRIFVDADACPVKDEIAETARAFDRLAVMVASHDHRLEPREGVQIVQVDRSDQAVDLYIANHIRRGDVLVTQDFGLAALALAKGAACLSTRGQRFEDGMIDYLLERRGESARRRRGGQRTKGPKAFTAGDREQFLHGLTKLLQQQQENKLS
ncbi:hypothetical protein SD70_04875 [Gordoniibacillus kamchatkensis]|uniref:UPF0178 protein SD70_04875 n=1 Tax=Gordoniibacillus kamchatkensis TaxID=1590651 RepID=A0ABR5AMX6_9BACL|nr:DUF188 domain-containing protein [Paenibacillus sp. VKM B-2647]KIL41712.1 hypothetical protein SD70_04875 [Paenibacillus sp. VKM B-2647]